MTRTLFVGEPTRARPAPSTSSSRAAQAAASSARGRPSRRRPAGAPLPAGRTIDAVARAVIEADGRWPAFGHGLGHGIGLATHELPEPRPARARDAAAAPTVFSVEPGHLPRGRDRRPDRGPRGPRRRGRPGRAAHPLPARGRRRRDLTRLVTCPTRTRPTPRLQSRRHRRPRSGDAVTRAGMPAQEPTHDQHR